MNAIRIKPTKIAVSRSCSTKKVNSSNILNLKEKELCKLFYHKIRTLQTHNQFKFDFFIFHVANQQNTSKAYTLELIRMGLRAGVADYCILFPGAQTAFLELKRNERCRMSKKQESFQKQCFLLGNPYMCTHDIDLAISWIENLGEALLLSSTGTWG